MFRLGARSILQNTKPIKVSGIQGSILVQQSCITNLLANQIRTLSITPQKERHLWLRKKKSFGHPYSKTHPRVAHFK